MTDVTMMSIASTPGPENLLRRKIGWLCHAIRIAAVLWACWILFLVIRSWSDSAELLHNYGLLFSVFVFALAQIFKTAAKIADDHSGIV